MEFTCRSDSLRLQTFREICSLATVTFAWPLRESSRIFVSQHVEAKSFFFIYVNQNKSRLSRYNIFHFTLLPPFSHSAEASGPSGSRSAVFVCLFSVCLFGWLFVYVCLLVCLFVFACQHPQSRNRSQVPDSAARRYARGKSSNRTCTILWKIYTYLFHIRFLSPCAMQSIQDAYSVRRPRCCAVYSGQVGGGPSPPCYPLQELQPPQQTPQQQGTYKVTNRGQIPQQTLSKTNKWITQGSKLNTGCGKGI